MSSAQPEPLSSSLLTVFRLRCFSRSRVKFENAPVRLMFDDLGGLAKVMPFAGLAFGFAAFAAIGLPGLANFAGEIMIFFGAFQTGWDMHRFHIFQVATVLALWGVVISAVYMLRAYRRTFMGAMAERWAALVDLRSDLRLPVFLLVAALIWYGFFPQFLVRTLTSGFKSPPTAEVQR